MALNATAILGARAQAEELVRSLSALFWIEPHTYHSGVAASAETVLEKVMEAHAKLQLHMTALQRSALKPEDFPLGFDTGLRQAAEVLPQTFHVHGQELALIPDDEAQFEQALNVVHLEHKGKVR